MSDSTYTSLGYDVCHTHLLNITKMMTVDVPDV